MLKELLHSMTWPEQAFDSVSYDTENPEHFNNKADLTREEVRNRSLRNFQYLHVFSISQTCAWLQDFSIGFVLVAVVCASTLGQVGDTQHGENFFDQMRNSHVRFFKTLHSLPRKDMPWVHCHVGHAHLPGTKTSATQSKKGHLTPSNCCMYTLVSS